MKNKISTLLVLLFFIPGFSQNSRYAYLSVKMEKLSEVTFIWEIVPELCRKLALPFKERADLDFRISMEKYSQEYYGYYHASNDNTLIDYVSVEIAATCKGKTQVSQSSSDKLTKEQKNNLNTADPGTDIIIRIKFKYKNQASDNPGRDNEIIEGQLAVAVAPDTEAEYPGGVMQLTKYLIQSVRDKIPGKSASEKIRQAIVKFTVNEEGQLIGAKIDRTSTDPKIDKLLLEAATKMPKWKPAENSKGIKVKQEFSIPLGGSGC